jgi:prepilin-type N-terminal cleavage/methylation domain-containing protein
MNRRRRGFTLPETLMAMVVMAAAVGIFGAVFPSASQAISRSKHIDMASDECQKQLDKYRQIGETAIELSYMPSGTSRYSMSFTPSSELPGATGSLVFRRVDTSYVETTSDTGRMRVDVSVSWRGVGRDRGTIGFTSLIVETPR